MHRGAEYLGETRIARDGFIGPIDYAHKATECLAKLLDLSEQILGKKSSLDDPGASWPSSLRRCIRSISILAKQLLVEPLVDKTYYLSCSLYMDMDFTPEDVQETDSMVRETLCSFVHEIQRYVSLLGSLPHIARNMGGIYERYVHIMEQISTEITSTTSDHTDFVHVRSWMTIPTFHYDGQRCLELEPLHDDHDRFVIRQGLDYIVLAFRSILLSTTSLSKNKPSKISMKLHHALLSKSFDGFVKVGEPDFWVPTKSTDKMTLIEHYRTFIKDTSDREEAVVGVFTKGPHLKNIQFCFRFLEDVLYQRVDPTILFSLNQKDPSHGKRDRIRRLFTNCQRLVFHVEDDRQEIREIVQEMDEFVDALFDLFRCNKTSQPWFFSNLITDLRKTL